MSEENVEDTRRPHRLLSILTALLWERRTLAILGALALTWWVTGTDSWFEDPLPERLTVFLIIIGVGTAILLCTGVLRLCFFRLSDDDRAHLRDQFVHPLEAAGLRE